MKNSALIRIFSFKRFLRLLMGLLLFSNCMLSSDLLDPDEAYVALVCYERVPDPMEDRFECGNGTKDDPFVIANLAQLMVLQSDNSLWDPGQHFDVILDLDLGIGSIPNWQPIGNTTPFKGTFRGLRPNGQPVQIFNLRINQSSDDIGFFGYTDRAVIVNVGLENVKVTGAQNTGGLVGKGEGGTEIRNSYVTGTVTGTGQNVGGFVGENNGGSISNSYATVNVTGTGNSIGGLVGNNASSEIGNSYSTGDVTGAENVGGLVGANTDTISNSYATAGTVMGTGDNIGGLVGINTGTISNSYATAGTVTGDENVGGLVGNSFGSISNSYATGTVTGNTDVGGLVGDNTAFASITGTNYFKDTDGTAGAGIGNGSPCVGTCTLQTLEQLRGLDEDSAFTPPWPSSSWTRLDQAGFPCIATITFGRGGCPP